MSADSHQHSNELLELRLPRASAVAIHYPGYIANVDKALQTLGGEAVLFKALQDGASLLKLRMRPEDQFSHPLFGERQDHQGLVLRISRPRGQPDADPSITVASRVHASYAFSGLADYQFLGEDNQAKSRDLSGLSERNKPAAAEPFKTAQPFLLVPPIFSKVDMPVAFAFRDQAPAKDSDLDASSSRKRIVSFYETSLPPELPLQPEQYATPEAAQQLEQLKELLSTRPAWPLELLLERLPGSTPDSLAPALTALCYQFKTGPWKCLYLACGFDPRASLEGRPYQLISYRMPTEWSKVVKAAKAAGRPLQQPLLSHMTSFSALPVNHTTLLQLCDMAQADAAISQLLAGAPVPPGPSEAYGWFTYSSSQQLQQGVQMAFSKLLKQQLEQQQQQQEEAAAADGDAGAAAAAGEQMDVDQTPAAGVAAEEATAQPPASKQQQQGAAAAGTSAAAVADEAAADEEAAAEGAEPLDGLVDLLGLGAAQDELQAWLQEEAAAAEERGRRREAAAAAVSDADSTDAGLSEGDSDWATSAGETTGDEGTDADEYDDFNEDV